MKAFTAFYCPDTMTVTLRDSDGYKFYDKAMSGIPDSFLHKDITEVYHTQEEEEIFEGHDDWDYDRDQDDSQYIDVDKEYTMYMVKSICLPRLFKRNIKLKSYLTRYQPKRVIGTRYENDGPELGTAELLTSWLQHDPIVNKPEVIKEIHGILKSIDEG